MMALLVIDLTGSTVKLGQMLNFKLKLLERDCLISHVFYITRFLYKQLFYKQRQVEVDKKLNKS